MEIRKVNIGDVKPYFNNPRDNARAIAPTMESIRKYGFVKPIMVDSNCVVICGHTRLMAALRLGLEEVPVIVSDMSEDKAKQFRILDNKLAEKSEYDEDELINELKGMETPEEMQAFFFEDIHDMLNMDMSFVQQTPVSAFFNPSEDDDTSEGGGIEEEESQPEYPGTYYESAESGDESRRLVEQNEEANEESAEPEQEIPLYKPYLSDGVYKMKIVCPYCGNVEEICLTD